MSRLIKFRAWNSYDKEMIYDVEHTYDFLCSGYGTHEENFGVVLDKEDYVVMQFTGLCDKNGKELYEGDILRGFTYPYLSDDHYNYLAEVVWFDNCAAFGVVTHKAKDSKVSGISDGNTDYMDFWNSDDWEVIGNIYENSELLGEEYDG